MLGKEPRGGKANGEIEAGLPKNGEHGASSIAPDGKKVSKGVAIPRMKPLGC